MNEPNVFSRISCDHRRLESLFSQARAVLSSARGRPLWFQALRDELRIHNFAEETVIYPFLQRTRDTDLLAAEAAALGDRLDDLLDELDVLQGEDPAWRFRFQRLRAVFGQHVACAEGDVFPHLRRYFPSVQLEALGPKYEKAQAVVRAQMLAKAS